MRYIATECTTKIYTTLVLYIITHEYSLLVFSDCLTRMCMGLSYPIESIIMNYLVLRVVQARGQSIGPQDISSHRPIFSLDVSQMAAKRTIIKKKWEWHEEIETFYIRHVQNYRV